MAKFIVLKKYTNGDESHAFTVDGSPVYFKSHKAAVAGCMNLKLEDGEQLHIYQLFHTLNYRTLNILRKEVKIA